MVIRILPVKRNDVLPPVMPSWNVTFEDNFRLPDDTRNANVEAGRGNCRNRSSEYEILMGVTGFGDNEWWGRSSALVLPKLTSRLISEKGDRVEGIEWGQKTPTPRHHRSSWWEWMFLYSTETIGIEPAWIELTTPEETFNLMLPFGMCASTHRKRWVFKRTLPASDARRVDWAEISFIFNPAVTRTATVGCVLSFKRKEPNVMTVRVWKTTKANVPVPVVTVKSRKRKLQQTAMLHKTNVKRPGEYEGTRDPADPPVISRRDSFTLPVVDRVPTDFSHVTVKLPTVSFTASIPSELVWQPAKAR